MNKFFVLSAIVFSIFFFACEDDTIPIPLPPSQPAADAPVGENTEKSSEPAKAAKSSAKEKPPAKAKEAPAPKTVAYFDGDSEQLKSGRYILQVGIFPTEASARKVIKKLADEGIKAYNAKVDNPDPEKGMIGTYNRVRIGFFAARNAAEAFAKTKLEPLGYSWWIDRSKNDNVGKLAYFEPEPVFEVERIPEQPRQMTAQERREAEIAKAKEEYRAIAKAANSSVALPPPTIPPKAPKAAPPPPPPQAPPPKLAAPKAPPPTAKAPPPAAKTPAPAEQTTKEAEIDNRGKVKMKSKR
jgi:hypothetical protein